MKQGSVLLRLEFDLRSDVDVFVARGRVKCLALATHKNTAHVQKIVTQPPPLVWFLGRLHPNTRIKRRFAGRGKKLLHKTSINLWERTARLTICCNESRLDGTTDHTWWCIRILSVPSEMLLLKEGRTVFSPDARLFRSLPLNPIR